MKNFIFLAVVILTLFGVRKSTMLPRGIRNNNPGNLRKNGIPWKGLAPESEQTDPDFYVFTAPHYGIRAMGRDLTKDYNIDGQRTIAALISEYAPGSENNTWAYINAVSREIGKQPNELLYLDEDLPYLVAAIIKHENGQQPYSLSYIEESLKIP
jgi:hypothetical protein